MNIARCGLCAWPIILLSCGAPVTLMTMSKTVPEKTRILSEMAVVGSDCSMNPWSVSFGAAYRDAISRSPQGTQAFIHVTFSQRTYFIPPSFLIYCNRLMGFPVAGILSNSGTKEGEALLGSNYERLERSALPNEP